MRVWQVRAYTLMKSKRHSKSIATMKNLFTRLMLVAVAAMGIVACQTEPEITTVPEKNTFTLTVTAEQETTRTYLGEADENGVYQAQWNDEGEVIRIFEYVNNSDATSVESTGFQKLNDGTAKFTAELTKIDEATVIEGIDYYAIYPESNRIKSDNEDITAFKFNTPTEQTPTATSFDGNADFMIAKPVVNQTEQLSELSMSFKRLVSIGKMTLINLDTESFIESVDLTFTLAEGAVAGYSKVNLTTSQYISCYQNYNTLKLSYNEPILKDTPIYFVSLPVCISEGDSFEIVVKTTDGCIFTRTVELTAGKEIKLTEGNMTGFKVDMSKAEKKVPSTDVFKLLKDVNELNAGDKIIIAAAAENYEVALSTTQNSNNRGQATITKNLEDDTISYGADVQILTVEAGTKAGTFAFNTGSGYLYAASSSKNYLRTETTLSDNSSWKIEISGGPDYSASIVAQGSNTTNLLRYNSSSSIFSCYSSGQADVAIYYLDGKPDTTPRFTVTPTDKQSIGADGGSVVFTVNPINDFTATVTATTEAEWLEILSNDDYTYTATASANTGAAREATITFSAEGYDDVVVTVSQEGKSTESYVSFDFSNPVIYGFNAPNAGAGTNVDNSLVAAPITITTTNGSTATRFWNSNGTIDLRVYKNGGSLKFTADSGKNITKIVFVGSAKSAMTVDSGTFSSGTWTGNATEVTFTATDTLKISSATVYYK